MAAWKDEHETHRVQVGNKTGEYQPLAGTQAPPIDTKPKRGRPPTGFDKKAHDRKKSADRRAKLKASDNGNG